MSNSMCKESFLEPEKHGTAAKDIKIMKAMTPAQQQFFNALPSSWKKPLEEICHRPEIDAWPDFLKEREATGALIYPAKQNNPKLSSSSAKTCVPATIISARRGPMPWTATRSASFIGTSLSASLRTSRVGIPTATARSTQLKWLTASA